MIASRRTRTLATAGFSTLAWRLVLVFFRPMLSMIVTSLKPESEVLTIPPTALPTHLTLDNVEGVLWRGSFPTLLRNSAIAASVSALLSLSIGFLAAYALTRCRFL